MGYRLAADAVVVFHLLFIVFVMFGGLLALRWKWLIVLHVPAIAWGMSVEFFHLYCPLTPLENLLRAKAGEGGYSGGFIEHYLIALIYPVGLTPTIQVWLGASVLLVNLLAYGLLIRQWRRHRAVR
jgi:cytochrome c biogenesis protein CcdA